MFEIEGIKDLKSLANVIDGELFSSNEIFTNLTVDSREACPGAVYLALKGDSYDGNIFCQNALENGCIAVITEDSETLGRYILVEDCYIALLKLASFHQKQINPLTIAITGSNGKTSVKEMMGEILNKDNTVITNSNENNQFGIPYTILRCNKSTENLILECGARHDGDFSQIVDYLTFDSLVITNINNSHVGVFGSIDNIINTKLELMSAIKPSGTIIEAAFENLCNGRQLNIKTEKINIYENKKQNEIELIHSWSYSCQTSTEGRDHFNLLLRSNDEVMKFDHQASINHNCINAVLASMTLREYDYEINNSMESLNHFENPLMNRFHINNLFNYQLIDDTYNANPASMISALNAINAWEDKKSRVVILGDMYDLGEHSEKEHQNLIVRSLELDNLKYLILVGERFKSALDKVKHDQKYKILHIHNKIDEFPYKRVFHHPIKEGILLVKGSRAMKMERFVQSISKYINKNQ